MDKSILTDYDSIIAEIKDMEKRIRKEEERIEVVRRDSVSGSMSTFPYIKKTIRVQGYSVRDCVERRQSLERYKKLMIDFCREAERSREDVEKYIQTLEDSKMRRILRYRYLDGDSWVKVAYRMGGKYTADNCRIAHNRFLKEGEDISSEN